MSANTSDKVKWLGFISSNIEHFDVSTLYNPPKLRWLIQSKTNLYPKTKDSDVGIFQRTKNLIFQSAWFGLLELSLPPFLSPKYHQMSVAKLTEHETKEFIFHDKYTINAVWFVNYCSTFGLGYLKELHDKLPEYIAFCSNSDSSIRLAIDMLCMLKSIGLCTMNENVPQLSDCAKNSKDFLQEPSIIIQLPWNTVLFHQWLVAALIEVLTFEKHTLELRHWPLPPQVEPVATQLLLLVKHLKEKIYLGFLILSHQVIDYPTVNTNHPTWILDNVVLPSLARLQFINPSTGKGHDILRSIKKLSWAKSEPESNRVYCPFEAYSEHEILSTGFGTFFYSPSFWFHTVLHINTSVLRDIDIKTIINEISQEGVKDIDPSRDTVHKIYSYFETLFIAQWSIDHPDNKYTNSEEQTLNKCMPEFIKKHIFDKGRLPEDKYKCIINYLNNVILNSDFTIGPYGPILGIKMLVAQCCLIHNELKHCMIEYEKETNILPHMVLLQYQITDREQILRASNLISHHLGITPVDINVKKYTAVPTMEVSAMLKCLSEVVERDRDWLWSQFPAQWRQPVTLTQPDINMDMPVDKIVKTCEDKIGRIIINAAQTCFDVHQKGGEIFPHWKTVQYIMPCYVAMLETTLKNLKILNGKVLSSVNFIKFIEKLLKYYETAYINWSTKIKQRHIATKLCKEELVHVASNLYSEFNHTTKLAITHMTSLIQSNFGMEFHLPGFFSTTGAMVGWFYLLEPINQTVLEHEFLNTWLLNSLPIIKDVGDICLQCWHEVNDNNLHTLIGYRELYETDEVIQMIGRSFHKACNCMFKLKISASTQCFTIIQKTIMLEHDDLHEWRLKFLSAIGNHDLNNESKSISEIYQLGKTTLMKIYMLYKQYRLSINKIMIQQEKYLSRMSEKHKKVQDLYAKGDFKTLESMLPSLFNSTKKGTVKLPKGQTTKSLLEKPLTGESSKTEKANKCRNCPKKEKRAGNFLICESCVKDKYPDVNYFCSVKCKEEWWGKEHKAEHLEFELGMLKF